MIATLTLAGALAATPAPDAPAPWRTLAASGPAEAREAEAISWRRLARGEVLEADDVVRTGRRARATLAQRKTLLVVDPASEVVLPREGEAPVVRQARGAVLYDVDGRTHRGMSVETPTLVAGVKGTVFVVTVRDGASVVTVLEGLVEVTSRASGESVEVGPGDAAFVDDGEAGGVVLKRADEKADDRVSPEMKRRVKEDGKIAERLASDDELVAESTHQSKEILDAGGSLVTDTSEKVVDATAELIKEVEDLSDSGGLVDDTRDLLDATVKETTRLLPPLPIVP